MKLQNPLNSLITLLLTILLLGCSGGGSEVNNQGNGADQQANSNSGDSLLVKSVDVFGVQVRASSSVENNLIVHAATILAEYLDNDEDGIPDDQIVVDSMLQRGATLVMARDEVEIETIATAIGDVPVGWQDLYALETRPGGSAAGEFDATLEEVLHLISHNGHAEVYPESLGEQPGSTLADAMDIARGGRFTDVPASYPAEAWYTYDDRTCDYECQVTEYFYWALTSMLGAQNYTGRLDEIQDEWRLNTRELVEAGDSAVFNLLTAAEFSLPTVLPDGNYAARSFTVVESDVSVSDQLSVTVIGAASDTVCRNAGLNDSSACFIVDGETALMYGVIDSSIGTHLDTLITNHSQVTSITMISVPGSANDEANLAAGRRLYAAGLNTAVRSNSIIASGGVDFFLAGQRRTIEQGAQFGVHSWAFDTDDGVVQGAELPREHASHQLYINYYSDIGLADPEGFYFYTLDAAPANDIHFMSEEDIERFSFSR